MRNKFFAYFLAAIAGLGFSAVGYGQEKGTEETPDPMMVKWQQYSTPAEGHKILEPLIGRWTYTIRWWMSPEAEPEESKGVSENRWILEKRFLQQDVEGVSMGQPFQGIGIVGYNNIKQEYNSVWIDSMATGMMVSTGKYDPSAKTLTESGDISCPMTGERHKPYRTVLQFVDDNHYAYSMFTSGPDGQEYKNMEIYYERAKSM